jgi:hypothetical protein
MAAPPRRSSPGRAPGGRAIPWHLATVLLVPVAALLVVLAARANLEGQRRDLLIGQFGPLTNQQLTDVTLTTACGRADLLAGQPGCEAYGALGILIPVALVALVLPLIILGAIWWAASRASRDPSRLATLFRPGLYGTIASVLVLIVLDGVLLLGAIWYGEPVFTGYRNLTIPAIVAIVVLVVSWNIVRVTLRVGRPSVTTVIGEPVDRDAAPALWSAIDATASQLAVRPPDQIVVGLDPTIFVTEVGVQAGE